MRFSALVVTGIRRILFSVSLLLPSVKVDIRSMAPPPYHPQTAAALHKQFMHDTGASCRAHLLTIDHLTTSDQTTYRKTTIIYINYSICLNTRFIYFPPGPVEAISGLT